MLGENMIMAFHAIMANKMRSFLTMLGIIIGIGSVISIVSIGDTMRGLFADLYKDAGATQAVVSIGYNVEDVRDSDYFTLDELDKIKEIFGDEISYIDSYASVNSEVLAGRTNMKFDFQGIDWNFSDVQPVTMNGQTGKICGKLPVAKGKLVKLFLEIFVPVAAILMIGGWFL